MEAVRSSETCVRIRTTRRYISQDGNIHNYRYENLISYDVIGILRLKLMNIYRQNSDFRRKRHQQQKQQQQSQDLDLPIRSLPQ
jgi:hypothetical protein